MAIPTNQQQRRRLAAIEKQLAQRATPSQPQKIPPSWSDFCALTTIRSGGRMVKFEPYPYQTIISSLLDKYPVNTIVKVRQMGLTQLIYAKFLHKAALNPAYVAAGFALKQSDASAIAKRVRQMVNSLSGYIQPENDNLSYLQLTNLGAIHFKNSSKQGTRSLDSLVDLLLDEAAFMANAGEIYSASTPSMSMVEASTVIVNSTPSAKSGWYWDKISDGLPHFEQLCEDVAAGHLYKEEPGLYWEVKNNHCRIILHWLAHPKYREINTTFPGGYLAYRQQQDQMEDEEILQREYNLRFVDSAVAVFSSELIRGAATAKLEEAKSEGVDYYIGIDTATTGKDYCCAIVLKAKAQKYSVVAMYRKRQQTSDYNIYQIAELIESYKPISIGIEVTGGVGQVFLEQLSQEFKQHKFISIRTTGDSKPMMISSLVLALEKKVLKIPSLGVMVEEMLNFRRRGRKLEAPPGKHDDTVMALAFALSVTPFQIQPKSSIDVGKIKVNTEDYFYY